MRPDCEFLMSTAPQKRFTFEEYLAWEEQQLDKHEFFNGEVYDMAGATFDHGKIALNLHRIIGSQSDQTGCQSNGPDLKVQCPTGLCTYPDVVVLCGKPEFGEGKKLVLLNPKMIFEVLSPSTMAYDRGKKSKHFRTIKSLTHYVLVSQNQPWVEIYSREAGRGWHYSEYESGSFELPATSSPIKFELAEIYKGIDFPLLEVFRDVEELE